MLRLWSCVVALVGLFSATTRAVDPPPPNARQPVDYVKWANETFGAGIRENAAAGYREAFKDYVGSEEADSVLKDDPAGVWNGDDLLVLKDWVHRNETCLAKLRTASQIEGCYFARESRSGALREAFPPALGPFREAGRLLATRARLLATDANAKGAVADIGTILSCARHLSSQPSLAEFAAACALRTSAYELLMELPRRSAADVDYDWVLGRLRQMDGSPIRQPLKQLEFEKVRAWDTAQRFLRDTDGDGSFERLEIPGRPVWQFEPAVTLDSIGEDVDAAYALQWRGFDEDYAKARSAAREFERTIVGRRERPSSVFVADVWNVAQARRRVQAERNAARIVLGMHAYQAKNGRWPENLKMATVDERPATRIDPFSGKPFAYGLRNGAPVFYSVGLNGQDDGGTHPAELQGWGERGDRVFWPPAGS